MNQDIEKLLEKYYEGETSLQEEKQLRQFFQQESIPEHLQSHAAQFRYFASARTQHPSIAFTNQLANKLSAPEPGRIISLTSWSLRLAASVALLILGFSAGLVYTRWQSGSTGTVASSTDEQSALAMKKVLMFEHLPKTSASERIQAVNQSYDLTQVDQEITQLLINTLNFDANVNVRLAACQALIRFENEPDVREALIQSLKIQTDPNIQITLIDALVAIKEKRAVEEIQRLVQDKQVLDVVRQKAEEGINQLTREGNTPS
ncbi:HEAT repeat domain-containing protein [Spirosoma sp. HMF4905]|uniref:HEAT repeat domain-containing protein n=1 Tax=Spirosoma arboris TaxID=2682092 RepID=A0A7K1S9S9_9BACT|nr:HEAT repeat domain-containing protein [Spirosoma arboris]MVM30540.1 HEAT repeat domain-containing protein [Spirosoma arboris]